MSETNLLHMIRFISIEDGSSHYMTTERAFKRYGPDELADMLAGMHPTLIARQMTPGEMRGTEPVVTYVCPWCDRDNPRPFAMKPALDGKPLTSHAICPECAEKQRENIRSRDATATASLLEEKWC